VREGGTKGKGERDRKRDRHRGRGGEEGKVSPGQQSTSFG
jgi:hypothetical protein